MVRSVYLSLFREENLNEYLKSRRSEMRRRVDDVDETDLFARDIDGWSGQLVEEFRVEVPSLGKPELLDLGEAKVDVSQDPHRLIEDRSIGFLVPGRAMAISVPYTGDPEVFRYRPKTHGTTHPKARVTDRALEVPLSIPDDREPDLRGEIEQFVGSVNLWLGRSAEEVEAYNDDCPQQARAAIVTRRGRSGTWRERFQAAGVPVRRTDAPAIFQAPGISRRPSPSVRERPAGAAVKEQEPAFLDEFWQHTLTVIGSCARAIERTPGGFRSMEEEQLRDFLLVVLNTHYRGAAKGEAFNASGKTDILITVEDRNVFVGECKFWSGRKGFNDALDQLLRYAVWRDVKLALVIFVKNMSLGAVIDKSREALAGAPGFSRWLADGEGELRCELFDESSGVRRSLATVFVHLPGE